MPRYPAASHKILSRSASTASSSPNSCTCCSDSELRRGPWTSEEDALLLQHMNVYGARGNWRKVPKAAGLLRCGKSCRLRWLNYLRPDLKRGDFSEDEDALIIKLHSLLGNRWSLIAGRIPGRSDNEIKNYWNFHLGKRLLKMGINPKTHKPLSSSPMPVTSPRKSSKFCHSLSFSSISSTLTSCGDDELGSNCNNSPVEAHRKSPLSNSSSFPSLFPGPQEKLDEYREATGNQERDVKLAINDLAAVLGQEHENHQLATIRSSFDHDVGDERTAADYHHELATRFQDAVQELEHQNNMVILGLDHQILPWIPPLAIDDGSDLGSNVPALDNGIIFANDSYYVRNNCS